MLSTINLFIIKRVQKFHKPCFLWTRFHISLSTGSLFVHFVCFSLFSDAINRYLIFEIFCGSWPQQLECFAWWFEVFFFWFRYICKALKTHLFGLVYSRQGTHFWVCITICRVRHGDSVTKPDYYYYYYLIIICISIWKVLINVLLWVHFVKCPIITH